MKVSNLILTFILALAVSFTLHSQSNTTREISIENDDESIFIKYEDGEIKELKIDGKTIEKNDYSDYKHILENYKHKSSSSHSPNSVNGEKDMQTKLHERIKAYLNNEIGLEETKYEFKLSPKYLKLNGKKLNTERLEACLNIYHQVAGYAMTKGSSFHVDIAPGSRSISLSIED